jgi:hypothetical protein
VTSTISKEKPKDSTLDFLEEEDDEEDQSVHVPKRRDDFIVDEQVDDEQVDMGEKMSDAMSVFGNSDFSEYVRN